MDQFLPNSLSISRSAFIRVSDTPAISSDVMNDPDITLATSTPRLSVTIETTDQFQTNITPNSKIQSKLYYIGRKWIMITLYIMQFLF